MSNVMYSEGMTREDIDPASVLAQLSPAQRRVMAAVERQRAGDPAIRVARPTREVLLRLGLMERGAPGQGHYTTALGDAVAHLALAQGDR